MSLEERTSWAGTDMNNTWKVNMRKKGVGRHDEKNLAVDQQLKII